MTLRAGEHKTSTLQDLEKGKPLELDVILKAVVELADLTGADLRGATGLEFATWVNTICPDGTNSDNNGATCLGHL